MSNKVMQFFPHAVSVVVVCFGLLFPEQLESWVGGYTRGFLDNFDWLILLASSGFLILCVFLIFSRHGTTVLGVDGVPPQYSTISWLSMLFAAGMGAGLVFWGTAEPIQHMIHSPDGFAPDDPQGALHALTITNLHWALHPWAIYGFSALAVAYFTFRKNQPLLVSSPMREQGGCSKNTAHIIDTIALLSIVFGVVASLGQGVLQVSSGVELLSGSLGAGPLSYTLVVAVLAACYMMSASGGINKGIKPLSDLNMIVCVLLMLFVLFCGPTIFLLQNIVGSLGSYVSNLVDMSFNLRHAEPEGNDWTKTWTLTYFLWWTAWGPFVGVFIARISEGRTIREFLVGVMLVPAVFSIVWFAILGGAGIHAQLGGADLGAVDYSMVTFQLLEQMPLSGLTQTVTVLLVFIFLVTSADSGTYVLGMYSTGGDPHPALRHRMFWGVIIALMVLAALLTGKGMGMLRSLVAVGAIPFLFIMLWQGWCLLRSLHEVPHKK
ncbi:MAG: BCCT family transporter [Alphaproteobacteria bacterium]|nr:BCCT family transporter [Alphaproteobacteria bacterium]